MTRSINHPLIGAYWPAREESRSQCAQRLAAFLRSLSTEPLFRQWHFIGRFNPHGPEAALEPPLSPVEPSMQSLEPHFATNNRDSDGTPIVDLGFTLTPWLWNGNYESPASLSVRCGVFCKHVGNAVILTLSARELPSDDTSLAFLRRLLEKSVAAWDPDYAVVRSQGHIDRARGPIVPNVVYQVPAIESAGGWLAYHRGAPISPLDLPPQEKH
jgi:hypothetical protein